MKLRTGLRKQGDERSVLRTIGHLVTDDATKTSSTQKMVNWSASVPFCYLWIA